MASQNNDIQLTSSNMVYYSSAAPSSSISTSPHDIVTNHDVFLSFHGKDTRYKFTSHLYEKLTAYGIVTYMDDPKLRIGEVISDALVQAIHDSKIYIVVFSENYAFSPWCLDEIMEIHQCYKEMNRLVVGVYCGIDPSVVRYQKKTFAEAFDKHEKGYFKNELDKVNKWRVNLTNITQLSGKHISAERSEADIINEVLDRIILEINPNTLYIAKHPVGLESRVEEMKKLLRTEKEKVGVTKIGIYGMRGVGKTTLAKSLYNQLVKESFKDSCFLANVRGVSEGARGLETLQKQLINDILKSKNNIEVHSVDHGIKLIEDMIRLTKVLIVVDDLDHEKQFESLVRRLAYGSVVIITTTDEKLLDTIKVKHTHRYKVTELDGPESLKLFKRHAFDDAEPSNDLLELSKEVLLHAGGLPLALEVFGSYLLTEDKVGWKAFIEQLQLYPIHDIEKKLVISYDALKSVHPILQDIFLDIACFFIGWEKESVVKIMETCYNSCNYYIDILKKRSLLSVNNRNQLEMHGLLGKMGKEIARNNSRDEPGKHSRLWASKDICYVLLKQKGTDSIKGIIPSNFYYHDALEGVKLPTKIFTKMSKLRFLYLKNVYLTGSFSHTFEEVTWLRWDCCPLKWLPSEFYAEKLVTFVLRGSKMKTLWEQSRVPRKFEMLKSLDMSYSLDFSTTPDFTRLPSLETLNLEGCKSLEEVHTSIGTLKMLISLNLCGCVNLKGLPDSICNLRTLEILDINDCSRMEALPTDLGNIESLTVINAKGVSFSRFPDSIRHLPNLVEMNVTPEPFNTALTLHDPTHLDVFSRFRGIDTRDGFIAHLYNALCHYGIKNSATTDDVELHNDEVISNAMKLATGESRFQVYVVVFLERHTFSTGLCSHDQLLELYNQRHVPVFHYRLQQQTQIPPKNQVNKWHLTLALLAKFAGYPIHPNRSEADVIHGIVEVFQHRISKALGAPKYSVGVDAYVEGIKAFLRSKTEGVTKIGIYGEGGVGKTTLAKTLHNQLTQESFKCSCYLADVREISKRSNGIESLQQQFINDILTSKKIVKVHSVDQGKKLIADKICSAKVLVVMDDLDDFKQYESLMGPFASGSVIIIVTRDQQILNRIPVHDSYCVRGLDEAQSLEIFNRHAFGDAEPDDTLNDLSKDILQYADGLPLALEVIGSYLSTQSEKGWIAYIKKLQQISKVTIQQQLLIIYDDLKLVDQAIFLDIACFFIGWKKEEAVRIMESCYPSTNFKINMLRKRCLLTINDNGELGMHGLLRDMGREIAGNTRLLVSKDMCDVLKKHKGRQNIEGIFCSQDKFEGVSFAAETFQKMSKLRFLHLKNVNLTGNFEHIFQCLRWLRWDWCPNLKCLPSECNLQELAVLELPFSKMRTLWEQNMVPHVLKKLRTLDMKYSQDLVATPDFTKLPYLRTLNLEGCKSLKEIHESVGSLVCLVSINLSGCVKLRVLPDSICKLSTLKVLRLDGCSSLNVLPTELGKLTSLVELDAPGLNILRLPNSMGDLDNLVELIISSNKKLQTLPDTICELKALKSLSINGCNSLKALPEELGNITSLRKLKAIELSILKLPDSVGHLTKLVELEVRYNGKLETLPDTICNLRSLENLDLRYCRRLLSIAKLPPNLKSIRADGCKTIKRLPNLSNLKHMELLVLTDCSSLTKLQGLEELTSIKKLHLGGCASSLLTDTLTECLFQIYSQFKHEIKIYFPAAEFPDWITQSPNWTCHSSKLGSTMSLDLSPNVSHNFLAMILCFKYRDNRAYDLTTYSVKNTTSGFAWSGSFDNNYNEAQIIIVPSSIFSVRDGDSTIELTSNATIIGIHLLYKHMITRTDMYNRVNVKGRYKLPFRRFGN